MEETDVVVLGGGPGGYVAAFRAADLGLRVTLVDDGKNPGGVCLYRGCIPSKALLHAASLLNEAREASSIGLRFAEPKVDLKMLRSWKEGVVTKLTGGIGTLARARKITHLVGRGRFQDAATVVVKTAGGGETTVRFKDAIVATGSLPATLPFLPVGGRVVDSTGALDLEDVPERLLVVGGGYIGAELATVYAALGSKVTIVEVTGGLLPGADRDLVKPLETRLKSRLEALLLNTRLTGAKVTDKEVQVAFEDASGSRREAFDKVLVAVGRKPVAGGIGLETTRVKVDEKGFIVVDEKRRTAEPHIFAIGDVAGQPMLAHKASHEGKVAAEVIAGQASVFEPQAIPAVVFTDPEIAWCGLTETEALARGQKVQVSRFPWGASGRATTLNRSDGLTKILVDPASKRVLGWGIAGPGAGELISEGVLAVEMGAVAEDVALSIHPHPTLSETIMEASEGIYGHATHTYGRG